MRYNLTMKSENNLLWIDLEMTGLDIEKDKILEVAMVITDENLNVLDDSVNMVIYQSKKILDNMDDWCIKTHGKSGLTKQSLKSKVIIGDVEKIILNKLKKYCVKGKNVLSGSSIYMDRIFMVKYMPKVINFFHYRIIDLTTIKELSKRWCPKIFYEQEGQNDEKGHRAMDDIKKSIEGMKFYREKLFGKN